MPAVAMQLDSLGFSATPPHRALRLACDELAGMASFGQMLRQARQSSMNGSLFNSSGERIFRAQLEDVLVRPLGSGLGEVLYQRLSGTLPGKPGLDVQG